MLYRRIARSAIQVVVPRTQAKAAPLTLATGIPVSQWSDRSVTHNPPRSEFNRYDPWYHFLPLFRDADAVVVCAVGNNAEPAPGPNSDDDDFDAPRRYARSDRHMADSLIVVGGTNRHGDIWLEQLGTRLIGTNQFLRLITVWAPGAVMTCAQAGSTGGVKQDRGTSLATAQVSALVATFLLRPDLVGRLQTPGSVAVNVKRFVVEAALFHTGDRYDTIKVLGTHNYVRCNNPTPPPLVDPATKRDENGVVGRSVKLKRAQNVPVRRNGVLQPLTNVSLHLRH